jgi:hypothetical protein
MKFIKIRERYYNIKDIKKIRRIDLEDEYGFEMIIDGTLLQTDFSCYGSNDIFKIYKLKDIINF